MKALVTGSKGFLGRHYVRALDAAGYNVIGIDIKGKHGIDCRKFFRQYDGKPFDLVVHAAAVVGGRKTIDYDPMAQAVNFSLDAEMFAWAARSKARQVVYISSSAAYPIYLQRAQHKVRLFEELIDLSDPQLPDALYGWSKLTGEQIAQKYTQQGAGDVLVIRPFSGYGSDQDITYPFPAIVRRVRKRHDPLVVWGSGEQVRDFVHVDDIVGATMGFLDQRFNGPVNIGTGVGVSMADLAAMVAQEARLQPTIRPLPDKPSGVAHRVCEPSLMLEFYKPKVTLREGIQRALRGI